MGKKMDASLKGKRPTNKAPKSVVKSTRKGKMRNPSHIKNKIKRSEVYGKYLQEKRTLKDDRRKREKEAVALGEDIKKKTPKTLDNTREKESTMVRQGDEEVEADHADDEFASYFKHMDDETKTSAKIIITTRPKPSQNVFYFIADLQNLIPSLYYYPRKHYSVKEICQFGENRDYTHLIVLSERHKKCNGMTISHLNKGDGPTAFLKVSNVVTSQKLPNHGTCTNHVPELNLHGFSTRLGHRVGRFLASLFPHAPQLEGRQVVTFHNQRDYIFVRHHRYIFYEGKKVMEKDEQGKTRARLQELGPRFTLKLRWLQDGTFDTKFGHYEWYHKRKEMDTTRRR
eukprot:CAMPEP_0194143196 /NCGR_PEP_ID=MMETSP0152-20130528/12388_1 /TAXON_ID=1049557 /ORGANISM="Thalassiothrix antarctica, Strain L6-D1" /LENGTH=341 /DNA_ID=CAMNT_0038842495 /DNA_START=84 /DNA_END=1105 /DNA_ORIENTATION=+